MTDVGKGSPKDGPPPFRIFLCSTSDDLKEHRARVAAAIERLAHRPARMETFRAEPRAPLEVCREEAASADALVVCVAHRYGWVPSVEQGGDGEKSVTWHEVDAARGAGKPVFAFLVDPEHSWTGPREQDRLMAATTPAEMLEVGVAVQGLRRFKDALRSLVIQETFTTPVDLAAKVTSSLLPWLLEQAPERFARPGAGSSEVDLTRYLGDLIDRTDHINISGISTQHARGALRYPIERLYTPLSSRGTSVGEDPMAGLRHQRLDLADLLPRHHRLLIEGQPGAGVVNVSWFEAEAYCRWLGEQRGFNARLPEEKEWEAAATTERGEYPWGEEEPDAERANFARNVESPTPVGVYPSGNGRYGHCDLAGNVWEMCLDEEELESAERGVGRVLRGGGWVVPAELLRVAYRCRHPASLRPDVFGFRVLVVPASP